MKICVTDRNGTKKNLDAIEGWRVMEIIRDHGLADNSLGLKAECGGALACATCHVHVHPDWLDKLAPPTDEEIDMLDEAFDVNQTSRLSCQILMRAALDGLEVSIAPGTEP